jgi:tRNA 2-selenouridine synthase
VSVTRIEAGEALRRLDAWSAILDARSETEHALDHLPGAVNWPTLTDAERASVGTEYTQVSAFEARKRGAVLAARNIARHVEREAMALPKDWQPLVYCWRGGQRSGSLATVLGAIGWRVTVLEGGYRAFRRAVLDALETRPAQLAFRTVCGPTGSGKSQLLRALAAAGAQVLDLEALARHRGSVLGHEPGEPQPSQKAFDTALWGALRAFDPARPVWVESESRKIGDVRLGDALLAAIRAAPSVWLEVPVDARVEGLLRDYAHLVRDTETFTGRLDALVQLRGRETIDAWQAMAREGRHAEVVRALLDEHYDPIYRRSLERNYGAAPRTAVAWDGEAASLARLAHRLAESTVR